MGGVAFSTAKLHSLRDSGFENVGVLHYCLYACSAPSSTTATATLYSTNPVLLMKLSVAVRLIHHQCVLFIHMYSTAGAPVLAQDVVVCSRHCVWCLDIGRV